MCLMLYLAADRPVPERCIGNVAIGPVDAEVDAALAHCFTKPFRRFVGVDGCSCAFPYVTSEEPIEYHDGMFGHLDEADRALAVATVRSLVDLVRASLAPGESLELYPAWGGEEHVPAQGRIDLLLQDLVPDRFFFVERFLCVIAANGTPRGAHGA